MIRKSLIIDDRNTSLVLYEKVMQLREIELDWFTFIDKLSFEHELFGRFLETHGLDDFKL